MTGVVRRIVRVEWRLMAADRAPRLAILLLAGAIVYAAYSGRQWLMFQRAAAESARQANAADMRDLRHRTR